MLTQSLDGEVAHAPKTANSKRRSSSFRWNWRNFGFGRGLLQWDRVLQSPIVLWPKDQEISVWATANYLVQFWSSLLFVRNCLSAKVQGFVFPVFFLNYVKGEWCLCFIEEFCLDAQNPLRIRHGSVRNKCTSHP